jgi:hypothetical protein
MTCQNHSEPKNMNTVLERLLVTDKLYAVIKVENPSNWENTADSFGSFCDYRYDI